MTSSTPNDREPARAAGERRVMVPLFVAAALGLLLLQEGAITGSDGASMYEVTRSLVRDGDLSVDDPGLGVPGRDGERYSKYGVGQPLIALLPYVAALPVAELMGERADTVERFAVSCLVPVTGALLVVALYALGRRLGARPRAAAGVAVGAVAGTFLLPYTKEFFSEPLTALTVTVAVERALAGRAGTASAALGLGILARPQTALLVPVFAWAWWREGGVRALVRAAPAMMVAAGATAAYNLARFGDATDFGYGAEEGFTTPVWRGAAGLLFDPSASLLLFAPVVVLLPFALARVWRAHRTAAILLAATFLITFVTTATWWSWAGGWSWGPRLLIPGVVPALAALGPWLERHATRARVATALFALGLLVSLPAMLVSTRAQQLDAAPPRNGPSVLRQYELLPPTLDYTAAHLDERPDGDHRRYLSLWQVNLAGELGRAGWLVAIPVSLVLAAGTALAGRRVARVSALQHGPSALRRGTPAPSQNGTP